VVYGSYYDATKKYLKVAKTTDYGTTWSSTTVAATKDRGIRSISIDVSGSNVYVSFFDYANNYLGFVKSLDGIYRVTAAELKRLSIEWIASRNKTRSVLSNRCAVEIAGTSSYT